MTLWMDKQEKGEMPNLVRAACDDVKMLDDFSADYAVGGFLIERKDWAEVAGRMTESDRDLYVQLEEMAEAAEELGVTPALLIEGQIGSSLTHSRIDPDQIAKYLAAVPLMGVTVIPSTGPRCSAKIIARYEGGDPPDVKRVRGAPDREEHRARFIVEGFPDVGPSTATSLLEDLGSVQAVVNATEEELMGTSGVGPATAKKIADARELGE